jgi:hypothetical protein
VLSSLKVSPTAFRAASRGASVSAKRGTNISYVLSEAAA